MTSPKTINRALNNPEASSDQEVTSYGGFRKGRRVNTKRGLVKITHIVMCAGWPEYHVESGGWLSYKDLVELGNKPENMAGAQVFIEFTGGETTTYREVQVKEGETSFSARLPHIQPGSKVVVDGVKGVVLSELALDLLPIKDKEEAWVRFPKNIQAVPYKKLLAQNPPPRNPIPEGRQGFGRRLAGLLRR